MKAIAVTCPHCGARLEVKGDAREVKCGYCETLARVQRRTQFFERPVPISVDGPPRVAIQKHTKVFVWVIVLTTVLPLLNIPIVIWRAMKAPVDAMEMGKRMQADMQKQLTEAFGQAGLGTHSFGGNETPSWQGTPSVLLADVDGNGTKEILGRTRRVNAGDVIKLAAIEGANGRFVWESDALGSYNDTYQGSIAILGDVALFGSQRGDVVAIALADGKTRWRAKIDERVKYFCDGGNGVVKVVGNDDGVRVLKLADGTPGSGALEQTAADKRRGAKVCTPLASDTDEPEGRGSSNYALGNKLDLYLDAVYSGPLGRAVAGQREKGTRVGLLVLLDGASNARWKVVVPQDPLGSIEDAPEPVAVGTTEVCAVYYGDSVAQTKRLACFAGADGKRLWDIDSGIHSPDGMMINNRALLIWSSGSIELRNLDGGAVLWKFGR